MLETPLENTLQPACFAAGTLVHTKDGLIPIENIIVGDLVLSKHESGDGEPEYKYVTRTYEHKDRSVIYVRVAGMAPEPKAYSCILTPEHPIWKPNKGWVEVGTFRSTWPSQRVELLLHDDGSFVTQLPMFKHSDADSAWIPSINLPRVVREGRGVLININTLEMSGSIDPIHSDYVKRFGRGRDEDLFKTTVYNIEVEDFYTYYVTDGGLWVHNKFNKHIDTPVAAPGKTL